MRVDIIVLLIHLLVIAIIDYKQHIIPDQAVLSLVVFKLGYDLIINQSFVTMLTNIGYALLITVPLLFLTVWMEKKTGKFQLGGGDLKLLLCSDVGFCENSFILFDNTQFYFLFLL
ncbi:MAG: prepilin peptidase [Erysipelotrichaceae bacterium]|nr:prepilin peptidase [Erysipelotrichaceae bacterium]